MARCSRRTLRLETVITVTAVCIVNVLHLREGPSLSIASFRIADLRSSFRADPQFAIITRL
jgi:hypothetical protein